MGTPDPSRSARFGRPEVAYGIGLDAVEWAKRGIIDHLIVAPFWATTDFNIPVEEWIEKLEGTGISVTAGLEALVRPTPGGPTIPNTVERRRGAALAMLGRGSRGIYLFNYFEIPSNHPDLLNELDREEALLKRPRTYTVTYTDITIPGKPIPAPLPNTIGKKQSADFEIPIGPKPLPSDVFLSIVYESTSDNPIYLPVEPEWGPHRTDRSHRKTRHRFSSVEIGNEPNRNYQWYGLPGRDQSGRPRHRSGREFQVDDRQEDPRKKT